MTLPRIYRIKAPRYRSWRPRWGRVKMTGGWMVSVGPWVVVGRR